MIARAAVALAVLSVACSPASPTPLATPPAAQPAPAAAPLPPSPRAIDVAVTVDDLPVHGPAFAGIDRAAIAERLLTAFRAHRLPPVYGFVNGKKVDDDPTSEAILRRWVASGNPLGNHTYSHLGLNGASVADYIADLEKGEAILRRLEPEEATWKVYRYPFLFEGDTLDNRDAVRAYLKQRGYLTAEVSIDGDDWAYNPPFARCADRHDAAALAELRRGLIEAHVDELRFVRALTEELTGRDVPQVLLLHIGAAEADTMDELLTAYEREGVRWIELRTALADPFYAVDPHLPHAFGAAFPYVVAKARGVTLPPHPKREVEDRAESMCR
jgi:peptidoglycan/xylan/chitin deacetylase (PgdA/CDA1 family)